MIFQDPSFLQYGVGVTALILVGLWSHASRRRRLGEFLGGKRAVRRLSRSDLNRFPFERALLLALAGGALSVAAAGPIWIDAPEPGPPVKRVLLAIDVSASMQAVDVEPTRLARSVDIANELIDGLGGHRVGLLLFAGTGYALAPPTHDHQALRFLLDGVTPTIASALDPGSLLSVGIAEGIALLEREERVATELGRAADPNQAPEPEGEHLLVLIGDGETGEADEIVYESVALATDSGVDIHTVGVGTVNGGGMIMPAGTYQLGGPVLDGRGERGTSRLRETLLREVATRGGGRYADATDENEITDLRQDLADLGLPSEASADQDIPIWVRYDVPFVLGLGALVFIFIESLLDLLSLRFWFSRIRRPA